MILLGFYTSDPYDDEGVPIESNLFTDQVKQEIHGGVNQNVHVENIKDVLFFRPTLEEQTYISDYLQKNYSALDGALGS